MNSPVTEAELQAWVDDQLAPARRGAVDDYLLLHPDEAARLQAYRTQNAALRARYDAVLDEPVPPALLLPLAAGAAYTPARAPEPAPAPLPPSAAGAAPASRPQPWPTDEAAARPGRPAANDGFWRPLRAAAMALLTLAGGAGGWWLHDALPGNRADADPGRLAQAQAERELGGLAHRAALAHAVYSPEIKHPVEVGADQEQHLVAWLSKRLGAPLHAPHLGAQGYELVGGRLLPGQSGPVAQFMYHDAGGARLTLYVSTEQTANQETGFRFAQEGQVGVFYWIDGKFGYALSGNLSKPALGKIANAVYAQLEPGA